MYVEYVTYHAFFIWAVFISIYEIRKSPPYAWFHSFGTPQRAALQCVCSQSPGFCPNMCKIQQSIILARKLKQKAVNIRLSMLFVCFCWRIVKVFSYMTICVVHCVTPLYLKTAGIDSPQILRSIQLLLQPEDSYNYAEQAAVYSSIATALAWAQCIFCTINPCARLWSIICLLGVHGWGRSYKCLIVFGNRDDSAPASGSIDMFPRCFVWKKHPVVPLDALQRNHRSASAARKSRR